LGSIPYERGYNTLTAKATQTKMSESCISVRSRQVKRGICGGREVARDYIGGNDEVLEYGGKWFRQKKRDLCLH
jgi:hypothetical protein